MASGVESAGTILFTWRLGLVFAEFGLKFSIFSFSGLTATRRVPSLGQILVAGEKRCPHSLQVLSIVILPESSIKVSNPSNVADGVVCVYVFLARKSRRINHQLLLDVSHGIII
jgi:hypothetical protein